MRRRDVFDGPGDVSDIVPGTAASTPAIIASRVVSTRVSVAAVGPPTMNVRAASPCQPSTIAPASTDTTGPHGSAARPGCRGRSRRRSRCRSKPGTGSGRSPPPLNDGSPGGADVTLGQPIELAGGDARLELLLDEGEDLGDEAPREPSCRSRVGLPGHHQRPHLSRWVRVVQQQHPSPHRWAGGRPPSGGPPARP